MAAPGTDCPLTRLGTLELDHGCQLPQRDKNYTTKSTLSVAFMRSSGRPAVNNELFLVILRSLDWGRRRKLEPIPSHSGGRARSQPISDVS